MNAMVNLLISYVPIIFDHSGNVSVQQRIYLKKTPD